MNDVIAAFGIAIVFSIVCVVIAGVITYIINRKRYYNKDLRK